MARTQTVIFVVSSLLVGSAIAAAGPIGFIGLVVPHGLRAIIGPDHRLLLPASILGGAVVLTVCDTLARTVLARWNIRRTYDFGRIVFAMVDNGLMQKTEEDSIEDFRDVFDFKHAFGEHAYRIELRS